MISAPKPVARRGQRAADRAHAADRHVPVAGAAADQVVEEAHVLPQRFVVGAGERPDQRVGRHHSADQIVAHRGGDRLRRSAGRSSTASRTASSPPSATRRCVSRVRSGSVIVGHSRDVTVPAPTVELARTPASSAAAPTAAKVESGPISRPGPPAVGRVRRVGRIPPPRQPDPHAEIVDDAARQQADQIGVARQPCVDAVEGVRRHRGAADVVETLQHLHAPARPGQVGRGHQTVVPAADDDDVSARHRCTMSPADQPR